MKTKQEGAALTAVAQLYCTKWHQLEYGCTWEEGGISCPAGETGGRALSRHRPAPRPSDASPRLPLCHTFSLVYVCVPTRMYSSVQVTSMWQARKRRAGCHYLRVRPYLIRTFSHHEWCVTSTHHLIWFHITLKWDLWLLSLKRLHLFIDIIREVLSKGQKALLDFGLFTAFLKNKYYTTMPALPFDL